MDSAGMLADAAAAAASGPGATSAATASTSFAGALMAAWANDPRALWSSFSMIVVSEIGDKTFLIAAILAMRQPRLIVFGGALSALALMSVLSAFMGVVLPTLLPRSLTTLMAAALFVVFGVRMLREGMHMKGDEINDEWEEAKREVEREEAHSGDAPMELGSLEEGGSDGSRERRGPNGTTRLTNGHASSPDRNGGAVYPDIRPYPPRLVKHAHSTSRHSRKSSGVPAGMLKMDGERFKEGARNLCGLCFSPVFAHAFVLTFLGEWGDRSQIATIALAAAHNIALVSIGTIVGHALCTSIAVLAGRWVATRISVKHVMLSGAVLFLLFGLLYGIESITEMLSGRSSAPVTPPQRYVEAAKEAAKGAELVAEKAVAGAQQGGKGGVVYEDDAAAVAAAIPADGVPLRRRDAARGAPRTRYFVDTVQRAVLDTHDSA